MSSQIHKAQRLVKKSSIDTCLTSLKKEVFSLALLFNIVCCSDAGPCQPWVAVAGGEFQLCNHYVCAAVAKTGNDRH